MMRGACLSIAFIPLAWALTRGSPWRAWPPSVQQNGNGSLWPKTGFMNMNIMEDKGSIDSTVSRAHPCLGPALHFPLQVEYPQDPGISFIFKDEGIVISAGAPPVPGENGDHSAYVEFNWNIYLEICKKSKGIDIKPEPSNEETNPTGYWRRKRLPNGLYRETQIPSLQKCTDELDKDLEIDLKTGILSSFVVDFAPAMGRYEGKDEKSWVVDLRGQNHTDVGDILREKYRQDSYLWFSEAHGPNFERNIGMYYGPGHPKYPDCDSFGSIERYLEPPPTDFTAINEKTTHKMWYFAAHH